MCGRDGRIRIHSTGYYFFNFHLRKNIIFEARKNLSIIPIGGSEASKVSLYNQINLTMKIITSLLSFLFFAQFCVAQSSEETEESIQQFRIAVQGGYGYRIAPLSKDIPPDLVNYSKNLKSGYNIGLDAAYFLKPTWGLGLKFSQFNTEQSIGNVEITFDDGSSGYGTMADKISIIFLGPSYISRYSLNNPDHTIFGGISLGYMNYKDEALLADRNFDITGATFGAAVDLGYDYSLSKYITLGAQASLTGGALYKYTVSDGFSETSIDLEEGNHENLSRLDISAGIRLKI